ncbi:MAG: CRISPR-associated ring nuclease Crn3/Csx3 [Fervidobacterium sp.]
MEEKNVILLEIVVSGNGVLQPSQLKQLVQTVSSQLPPEKFGTEGVVVSGRLPVWAYGALIHALHPFAWVGTFEPRLGKAVVVASHVPDVNVGDVVDIVNTRRITVTFP